MPELKYRTEDDRVRDATVMPVTHPVTSGDPLRPRTEAQRIAEAEYLGTAGEQSAVGGLLRDPETNHLIGIEQRPYVRRGSQNDDYPRWVTPHASHVQLNRQVGGSRETGDWETENSIAGINDGENSKKTELKQEGDNVFVPRGAVISVPNFEYHVRRHDGALFVLVHNEDEEKRAMGERGEDRPKQYVSAEERRDAERIYASERATEHAERREERIAEIINEQREAAIRRAEELLEAQRNREPAKPRGVDDDAGAAVTGGTETGKISAQAQRAVQIDEVETGKTAPVVADQPYVKPTGGNS